MVLLKKRPSKTFLIDNLVKSKYRSEAHPSKSSKACRRAECRGRHLIYALVEYFLHDDHDLEGVVHGGPAVLAHLHVAGQVNEPQAAADRPTGPAVSTSSRSVLHSVENRALRSSRTCQSSSVKHSYRYMVVVTVFKLSLH